MKNPNSKIDKKISMNKITVPSRFDNKTKKIMKDWGNKKKLRYVELVNSNISESDAFYAVEHNKGKLKETL